MPMAGVNRSGYRPQSVSHKAIGSVRPAKGAFNLFPAIADAFPGALSEVVTEVTDAIALDASAHAPVAAVKRYPSDPEPGNLRDSWKVTLRTSKTTGEVITGRIDFTAKSPDGNRYAFYQEVGTVHSAGHPFLVPAVMRGRVMFNGLVAALEARLPR